MALDEDFAGLLFALDPLVLLLDGFLGFRAFRVGLFQSTARSARNDAGIAATARFSSVTARAAASLRSWRTSAITLAGRLALAACTRFVSRITNISRSGSIQSEVPVNPVWPKAPSRRKFPEPCCPSPTSHPSAREPAARAVNCLMVESATMCTPL